jgi:transketolase
MSGYFDSARDAAEALVDLAARDQRVVALSQDFGPMGSFSRRFPERYFDLGISEENLIGVAAGLSQAGMRPFVFAMAPFITMHAFEQIRDDCAYNRNQVKIIAPFAGLEAGAWGATHHAMEDIALMRCIPGMLVLSPAEPDESIRAVLAAAEAEGPAYIRLGVLEPIPDYPLDFEIGKAIILRPGKDVTIIATGSSVATALAAHDELRREGISARVINMHTLKPLDERAIEQAVCETGRIVTVEEHSILGGLGGAVAEVMAEKGVGRLARIGIRDVFCTEVAPYHELLRIHGLDTPSVVAAARKLLELQEQRCLKL